MTVEINCLEHVIIQQSSLVWKSMSVACDNIDDHRTKKYFSPVRNYSTVELTSKWMSIACDNLWLSP
jgi:hypothetical protein